MHPDDFPETAEAFCHAIQTGTSYQVVHRLRRADGEFRWHQLVVSLCAIAQGRVVQWYGLSVDIDEAKKAEQATPQRSLSGGSTEAKPLRCDGLQGTTIFYGSEEIYRIWGFDPAQGVPSRKAVLQRIHPDDRDRLNAEVERAVSEKKALLDRVQNRTARWNGETPRINRPTCVLNKWGTGRGGRYTDRRDGAQARRGSIA